MFKKFFAQTDTRETVSLAWPLVITQVGHIVTGMVDNIFLGQLGTTEQAAGILSNNLYVLLLVFLIGMSYSSTPLVAGAHERNDPFEKASLFRTSFVLNIVVAAICFSILFFATPLLQYLHQPAQVVTLAQPFFRVLIFSMLPLSLFFTCKQFCEGVSNTKLALGISIGGNLINILLNYLLINGKLGLPEMGYIGSAWASFFARLFMGISFLVLVMKHPATSGIRNLIRSAAWNWAEWWNLFKVGFNAALQFTFEVAAFAIAALMAGSFGERQIDAHGIALSIAAFTYMFGSGIGSASTIRVGASFARNDWPGIRMAAMAAVKLAIMVMSVFGITFLLFNRILPRAFTTDESIIVLSGNLLLIAAIFQVFDGLQVTLIGILRGFTDVKVPTLVTLVGYWLLALPLAYLFAFVFRLETVGVWIGLLASLVFVACCLWLRLQYLLKKNDVAVKFRSAAV
jgi:MATE family multidrug resistance protein